jgi:hypothetical protein
MANNYTQGATVWSIDSKEEKDWFEDMLSLVPLTWDSSTDDSGNEYGWREATYQEVQSGIEYIEVSKFRLLTDDLEEYSCGDEDVLEANNFEYNLEDAQIYFFGEYFLDVMIVTELMHLFLKHFDKDGYFSISSAYFCDKLRPDEFGGACGFTTKSTLEFNSTYHWENEQIKKHLENKET